MLFPIQGANSDTQEIVDPALLTYDVHGEIAKAALIVTETNGPVVTAARQSYDTGFAVDSPALIVHEIGTTEGHTGEALVVHEVNGYISRAALRAFTVSAAPPGAWAALISTDVETSETARALALLAHEVHGYIGASAGRMSFDVRAEETRPALITSETIVNAVYAALLSHDVGRYVEYPALVSADVAALDGFLILVDIIGVGLSELLDPTPAGYFLAQDIRAVLTVDGDEVPIRAFDYQEPPDKLGGVLNVTLAIPDRAQVPMGAEVEFTLMVREAGGVERAFPLVIGGKIAGRDYTIQWRNTGPGDELTIAGLDVVGDRFSLAPRQPIIMFDPALVKFTDVEIKPRDAVLDEKGQPILPVLEPVAGLTMLQGLQRAYTSGNGTRFMTRLSPATLATMQRVTRYIGGAGSVNNVGLGFDKVITNIPNYQVARVQFNLESGWHEAVTGLVGMYDPIYFAENNILYIIDTERALPYAYVARSVPTSKYVRLSLGQPYRDPYNAVLLNYQTRATDDEALTGTRIEYRFETTENGSFGTLGYQRIELTQRVRVTYMLDDPTEVTDEVIEEYENRTYGHFPAQDGGPGQELLLAREKHTDTFDAEGLKTGHTKEVFGLITTGPDASFDEVKVLQEDCEIVWEDNPADAAQKIQVRNFTRIEGLLYMETGSPIQRLDEATGQMEDYVPRYPALVAQASGIISDDGAMGYGPIRTITETLDRTKGNQLSVSVQEIDLLTGTVKRSTTQPRTGSRATNPYESRGRTVMLRDLPSEAEIGPRVPASVSAGELPKDRAFELARRILARGFVVRQLTRLDFPGVDFAVRRGSVIKGGLRSGETPPVMVKGRTISGQNLGGQGHRIAMNVEGVELVT